jgi:hypothetical protein
LFVFSGLWEGPLILWLLGSAGLGWRAGDAGLFVFSGLWEGPLILRLLRSAGLG